MFEVDVKKKRYRGEKEGKGRRGPAQVWGSDESYMECLNLV